MTTNDDVPHDDVPHEDDRLAAARARIDEAAEAADEVARNENVSDEERRAAVDAATPTGDAAGHAGGEGAEVSPR